MGKREGAVGVLSISVAHHDRPVQSDSSAFLRSAATMDLSYDLVASSESVENAIWKASGFSSV